MGAFGTAFTLATQIDVLPITIYNEFTNYANFSIAAVLSLFLGPGDLAGAGGGAAAHRRAGRRGGVDCHASGSAD